MTIAPSNTSSAFLIQNQYFSDDQQQFLQQITKINADIARAVNIRDIASYDTTELMTGQQFFASSSQTVVEPLPKRYSFRTTVNFGALPNNSTKSVAHNIQGIDPGTNSTFSFTRIYGTATNPTTGSFKAVPIPYVNVGTPGDGIEIWVDATNVNIKTTTANWTAFSAIVVLEYLKN